MNKVILVCYLNIGNLEQEDIPRYIGNISKNLQKNKDVLHYFIPMRQGKSKIECINPKLVSENDYKQAKEVLNNSQKTINKFLKQLNPKNGKK